jgi:uncharacterized Zn-finger protein
MVRANTGMCPPDAAARRRKDDQAARKRPMADAVIPHFQNDGGNESIEIGAKEFQCIGARPPFDHPHVFLDMGHDTEIVCPYCSTLYRYNPALSATQSEPAGCLWTPAAA